MKNTQYADWLDIDSDKLFFWHHLPKKNIGKTAVIIIGPIGPEYMPSHRSTRLLARKIVETGINCIRYDPIGMGNSSGCLQDTLIWDKWVKTPNHITSYLKDNFNIDKIIFIAVRSGCLVLTDIKVDIKIDSAIFWYPQTNGSKYIRGIQLLDSVLYQNTSYSKNGILEGGGYPFTKELQNKIRDIDLTSLDIQNISNVLIIDDATTDNQSKLSSIISATNAKIESVKLDGLEDMVKQVTLSKIPQSNIIYIINWLNNNHDANSYNTSNKLTSNYNYITSNFIESTLSIDADKNMFGILTKPKNKDSKKVVIFPNTGAAHHAGPNRIHVDASRVLANEGTSTLRFDLSNLGESTENYTIDPPQEFPATAANDINTVINYSINELGYNEIILCGISAGAHNVFHAALESVSHKITLLILINPDTFYWNPNQSIHSEVSTKTEVDKEYYKKQILNFDKWLILLTSPKKLINTSLFLTRFILKIIKIISNKCLRLLNISIIGTLEKDIQKLASSGIKINLIYSKGDPGYSILMSQASSTLNQLKKEQKYTSIQISYGDHTFSSIASRKKLYKALASATS